MSVLVSGLTARPRGNNATPATAVMSTTAATTAQGQELFRVEAAGALLDGSSAETTVTEPGIAGAAELERGDGATVAEDLLAGVAWYRPLSKSRLKRWRSVRKSAALW